MYLYSITIYRNHISFAGSNKFTTNKDTYFSICKCQNHLKARTLIVFSTRLQVISFNEAFSISSQSSVDIQVKKGFCRNYTGEILQKLNLFL